MSSQGSVPGIVTPSGNFLDQVSSLGERRGSNALAVPELPTVGSDPSSIGYAILRPNTSQLAQQPRAEQNVPKYASALTLTELRQNKGYALYWPDRKTELKPESHSDIGEAGDCYKLLKQEWDDLPTTGTHNSRMKFLALPAKRSRQSLGFTADHIAVKIISVNGKNQEKEKIDAELQDARAEFEKLSKIRHCHIIAALDMFQWNDPHFPNEHKLVMMLYPLAVTNLDDRLKHLSDLIEEHQGPAVLEVPGFSEQVTDLINYMPCLCQALLHLHSLAKPIKHRDIKPQNILIDGFRGVILADLNISRQYDDLAAAATNGVTSKTLQYAAPAVLSGLQRHLEVDVISLGFVFLEMLTVILGVSRNRLFEHFPPDHEPNNICHGDALTKGVTQQWTIHLEEIARSESFILEERDAVSMLDQIRNMMSAGYQKDGVLQEAYECFQRIAAPCPHCRPHMGNERPTEDSLAIVAVTSAGPNITSPTDQTMVSSEHLQRDIGGGEEQATTGANPSPNRTSASSQLIPPLAGETALGAIPSVVPVTPAGSRALPSAVLLPPVTKSAVGSSASRRNHFSPQDTAAGTLRDDLPSREPAQAILHGHRFAFVTIGGTQYEMLDFDQLAERCRQRVYEYYHPTFFELKPKVQKARLDKYKDAPRNGIFLEANLQRGPTLTLPNGKSIDWGLCLNAVQRLFFPRLGTFVVYSSCPVNHRAEFLIGLQNSHVNVTHRT